MRRSLMLVLLFVTGLVMSSCFASHGFERKRSSAPWSPAVDSTNYPQR
ncbi:MAG: hypothetical protein HRU15_18935 [Planctomycetes bacterium]|nr:hypothetical protein [Planctomycetota bacterium]